MYFLICIFLHNYGYFPIHVDFSSVCHIDNTCTINLVLISQNKSIFQFPQFKSSNCKIKETFYYIHSGAGTEISSKKVFQFDDQINYSKIVRVNNIDTGNLFALALSIYFPSKYVLVFDIDRDEFDFKTFSIDESIKKLKNSYDIIFTNPSDPVGFLSYQFVVRRFLLYTDITYSDESSLSILYSFYSCEKVKKYLILNQKVKKSDIKKICKNIPKYWKCDKDSLASNYSNSQYAVLIPTFKRNYLNRSIESWEKQELKPSEIIIFQNRMHVTFDFGLLTKISSIKLNHFWCTNWNSYFFLTYSSMMFLKEKFFIKTDDDYFLNESNAAKRLHQHIAKHPNSMVSTHGLRNYVGYKFNCGCSVTSKKKTVAKRADYFSLVVIMSSSSGKILHRFSIYSYKYAEDVAIALTNALECGTTCISISKIKSIHLGSRDGLSHSKDKEFNKTVNSKELFKKTSCHYILYGYKPIIWKTYNCDKKKIGFKEIRYPH